MSQCRWAMMNDSESVLLCCHDEDHESEAYHSPHYEIAFGDRPAGYPPPTDEQDARRTWMPEWFWKPYLAQLHERQAVRLRDWRLEVGQHKPPPRKR